MAKAKLVTPQDGYLIELKRKFTLSQDLCEPARKEWLIDQGYYDGQGQWTPHERQMLRERHQPDTYFNEVKPSINGMIGIVERGKIDPRALGRNPEDEDSAEVATKALRYVADKSRLASIRSQALRDLFIPGVCVAAVEIDPDTKEVKVTKGRPETFFYDPHSREPDFSDARWLGLAPWMDEDDAIALYPDFEKEIRQSVETGNGGLSINATSQDRPREGWAWGDTKTKRLFVVEMYHKKRGVWQRCVFVVGAILEEGPSPYLDADKKPSCNLIAQSAYVDADNRRYGAVRDMRGPQDAQNKGWSKAIHIISVSKLRVDPGVADVDDIRKEFAKPDGIVVAREGQIEELGDHQLLPAHMELLNLAETKMRRQAPTPGIVGRNASSQSGKAILAEQQAGMTEQSPLLGNFDDWTLRIYRAAWGVIKQFWTAQKYIRITDDANAASYVMLNEPALMMQPGPDGNMVPVTGPDGKPVIDPSKPPRNRPAEMDVDIIIDSQPDVASLAETQFQSLMELSQTAMQTQSPERIPFKLLVQASSLPNKRQLLDALKEQDDERKQQAQQGPPPNPEMLAVQAKAEAAGKQHELDMAEADHKAQLATKQAQDDHALAVQKAADAKNLAEQEFALEKWVAEQKAWVAREAVAAQIGLDQELADHQAIMTERKAQMEFEFKAKQQAHDQQLSGDKHNTEKQRTLEMARASKGESEPIEPPKPSPKRVAGSIKIARDKLGKPAALTINHVLDDGTTQTQQMTIDRGLGQQQPGQTMQ